MIGAAIGAVGNIVATAQQNAMVDKQIQASREENDANRAWNRAESREARKWSQQQWEREMAYNTPLQQRARMREAGLNADLMYGQGGASNVAPSSPSVTPTAPSSPTDVSNLANKRTFGDALTSGIRSYYDTKLSEAQIENIEADTQKKEAEAEGTGLTNKWIDKISGNQLDIGNATIKNLDASALKSSADTKRVDSEIEQIHTNIDSMRQKIVESSANIENLSFNQAMKRIELAIQKDVSSATISKLAADTGKTHAEIKQMQMSLPYLIEGLVLSNDKAYEESENIRMRTINEKLRSYGIQIENGILQLNVDDVRLRSKNRAATDKVLDDLGFVGTNIRTFTTMVQELIGGSLGALLK